MGGVSVRETDCRCPADDQRGPGGPGQGAPSPHEISYLDDIRGDAVCVYQAGVDLPVMVDEYAVQVYLVALDRDRAGRLVDHGDHRVPVIVRGRHLLRDAPRVHLNRGGEIVSEAGELRASGVQVQAVIDPVYP